MEVLEIPKKNWFFNIMYFYREEEEKLILIVERNK
jgi:hypothetical protein